LSSNPKTCCGRAVCQCRHAKNVQCPIRFAKKNAAPVVSKKRCHLEPPAAAGTEKPKDFKEAKRNGPLLKKAPCHSEKALLTLPSYAKDFFPDSFRIAFNGPVSYPYDFPEQASGLLSFSSGIDRPPRVF